MSLRTILTLANGRGIDLKHPSPADYAGFGWVAEHLAKEKRYNGATPGVEYSVAQHLVWGHDAILLAQSRGAKLHPQLRGLFLLHDVPEGALKDDTTPKKNAIAEIIAEKCGILAPVILECFDDLTARHDAAAHEAAGLPWPLPEGVHQQVKMFDLIMFVTEWRDLMGNIAHPNPDPYRGITPLSDPIVAWDWGRAASELMDRFNAAFPALTGRAA